ncbi:MAG: siroheme synthase CysG, partial [Methyloligellaceae bacterium]
MKYFPIYVDLERQPVLVVGGGEQAAQKIRLLLKTHARITVLAETLIPELEDLAAASRIQVERRGFRPEDVADRRLVYAATGEDDTDQAVADAARARNVPVNVVDRPDACSFITPAIVDRDPVTVAIGTEGAAPVLAREIKSRLERELPAGLGLVAERAQGLRARVAREIGDGRLRRRLWERLLQGRFRERILAHDEAGAALAVDTEIDVLKHGLEDAGRVTLIGCGPGDPDLLTLRAQQRLQEADVLVVDRLVNPRILEFARRDAERIFVGKTPGGPTTSQDEISRILVREAEAGKTVARLKGGDPLIFGRAVEEMLALQQAGIACEVVPGISAAHASAASLNLPVTSRGHHRKFSVLTGATA